MGATDDVAEADSHAALGTTDAFRSALAVFRQFDTNDDGTVDKDEMKVVFDSLGVDTELWDDMINAANLGSSKGLDYERFISWLYDDSDAMEKLRVHLRAR